MGEPVPAGWARSVRPRRVPPRRRRGGDGEGAGSLGAVVVSGDGGGVVHGFPCDAGTERAGWTRRGAVGAHPVGSEVVGVSGTTAGGGGWTRSGAGGSDRARASASGRSTPRRAVEPAPIRCFLPPRGGRPERGGPGGRRGEPADRAFAGSRRCVSWPRSRPRRGIGPAPCPRPWIRGRAACGAPRRGRTGRRSRRS